VKSLSNFFWGGAHAEVVIKWGRGCSRGGQLFVPSFPLQPAQSRFQTPNLLLYIIYSPLLIPANCLPPVFHDARLDNYAMCAAKNHVVQGVNTSNFILHSASAELPIRRLRHSWYSLDPKSQFQESVYNALLVFQGVSPTHAALTLLSSQTPDTDRSHVKPITNPYHNVIVFVQG